MPVLDPQQVASVARTRELQVRPVITALPSADPTGYESWPKNRALAPGWDEIQHGFPAKFLASRPRGALCFLALDPQTPSRKNEQRRP